MTSDAGGDHAVPTAVHPVGESALLVTFDRLDEVVAFRADLRRNPATGVVDVVSAARTLLVRFDPVLTARQSLAAELTARRPELTGDAAPADTGSAAAAPTDTGSAAAVLEIPVVYDGDDLDDVGRITGLGARGVVEAHLSQLWTSAFCGFAPGFSYLVGSGESLALPRRSTPRTSVPAGAVALAGEFSAVYPRSSPGGWQLIGHTTTSMWSLDRDPPALAPAGTRLCFVEAAG